MTTELLKQALSAMRDVADLMADRWPMDTQQRAPKFFQAMRDIDTALAQPADEDAPIPWRAVIQAIHAVDKEAYERGKMYPQTYDEQQEDRSAVRRVTGMIEWYATSGGAVAEQLPEWPKALRRPQQAGFVSVPVDLDDLQWPTKEQNGNRSNHDARTT